MSLLLGAVADGYTGASDLANTFRRNGLSTIQVGRHNASTNPINDAACHALDEPSLL